MRCEKKFDMLAFCEKNKGICVKSPLPVAQNSVARAGKFRCPSL